MCSHTLDDVAGSSRAAAQGAVDPGRFRLRTRIPAWVRSDAYLATLTGVSLSLIVFGCRFGPRLIPRPHDHNMQPAQGALGRMTAWDGEWYARIAETGYSYDTDRPSSVVFFPAYPLTVRAVSATLHLPTRASLLLVSNVLFLLACALLLRYLQVSGVEGRARLYVLAAAILLPSTLFFRLAYTESMLLFLLVLSMYAMQRGWSPAVIALLIGLATATRAVGVALIVPFALHLWRRRGPGETNKRTDARSWRWRWSACTLATAGALILAACWGLLLFMGFQWRVFCDPLAFAHGQIASWHNRASSASAFDGAVALLTFEPIRAVYDPGSPCYWKLWEPAYSPLLNMQFMNPLFFAAFAGLTALGIFKRWIGFSDGALSFTLLLIPYVTQGYRMCMQSQARFAAVAFPAYIVAGRLLAALPVPIAIYVLAVCAALMTAYAALFASGYPIL